MAIRDVCARGSRRIDPVWGKMIDESTLEQEFATKRPWVYHLTAFANVTRIRRMGRLQCAAAIMRAGNCSRFVRRRREGSLVVRVDAENVHVRDQGPLLRNNMWLHGCSFEDWVAQLNGLVFFWPGRASGPTGPGQRHFDRYASERPAVIRIPTADLLEANRGGVPRFSCYNSGAPRWSGGRPSPRGLDTFTVGDEFGHGVSRVVEVAYCGSAILPATAELGGTPQGPWRRFLVECLAES